MKNEYNIATKKGFEEKDLEDILIISEIKKGDTKAFGKIYDKYYNEILIKMTYLYNGNVEKAKDLTCYINIVLKMAAVNLEGGLIKLLKIHS